MIIHIIIVILKILLCFILAVLGLFLALILSVLFVPIRCQAKASLFQNFQTRGRVSWLFRALSICFSYIGGEAADVRPEDRGLKIEVRLFGFRIFKETGKEVEEKGETGFDDSGEKPEREYGKLEEEDELVTAFERGGAGDTEIFDAPTELPVPAAKKAEDSFKTSESQTTCEKNSPKGFHSFGDRILRRIRSLWKRFRKAVTSLKSTVQGLMKKKEQLTAFLEDEENQKTFHLVVRQGKRLAAYLLPHISGEIHFGIEDPYLMGQLLSILAVFYPMYGKNLILTSVFDENMLEGSCSVKGRVRIGTVLFLGLRILLDRNFRRLLRRFLRKGGI